ncbi:hypothetical protein [Winogradskyella undariae]|uniref:hypothetical protein n=1 Tax=Winogradskyella undariae TaxID=1285465 RepID=UPI0015CAED36|nr:hypothetical protein [Winogradskyella undariae]
MTRLFTLLLFVFSLLSYAQKNTMNDITNLVLNTKTEIDNSLSIKLTKFSHKNATSDKQASVASGHLIIFQEGKKHELTISMYESADRVSHKKQYDSINWNEYTIKLKHINYNESIDVVIIKNDILLNKNQLIEQANKIIISKYPEFTFDSLEYEITAWRNKQKTIVKYIRIIRFTPLNKKDENLYYDFEVNLTNQNIWPFDIWGLDKFYFPTSEEQNKIDFVIENLGLPYGGFNNSIIEYSDTYTINIDNDTSFSNYYINKTTGKVLEGVIEGAHYDPMPPEDFSRQIKTDPLIEIK